MKFNFLLYTFIIKLITLKKKKKVSIITFITYLFTGEDHVLTPERAFVCLTLFDIIKMPLAILPLLLVYIVEVNNMKIFSYQIIISPIFISALMFFSQHA